MAKVSIQEIANKVGTSRVTVWKALNNRPGVSENMRRDIFSKAEELGYFSSQKKIPVNILDKKNVAVVVSRPDSSNFWLQIIHELARFLNQENVNLLYVYLPSHYNAAYQLPSSLEDGSLDAIVVLNVYCTDLLRRLNALPMHKVFLDLTPEMENDRTNGDLLFIEGKNSTYRITQRLLQMGKTKVAFVGDVHYAKTNVERHYGYHLAFEETGVFEDPAVSLLGPIPINAYPETIAAYLDSFHNDFPEAFVCASDHLAHYIERYFAERGIQREGEIILTGFDNNKEYQNTSGKITTVDVDTHALGDILAQKILFRLIHRSQLREISYVGFPVIFRGEMDI